MLSVSVVKIQWKLPLSQKPTSIRAKLDAGLLCGNNERIWGSIPCAETIARNFISVIVFVSCAIKRNKRLQKPPIGTTDCGRMTQEVRRPVATSKLCPHFGTFGHQKNTSWWRFGVSQHSTCNLRSDLLKFLYDCFFLFVYERKNIALSFLDALTFRAPTGENHRGWNQPGSEDMTDRQRCFRRKPSQHKFMLNAKFAFWLSRVQSEKSICHASVRVSVFWLPQMTARVLLAVLESWFSHIFDSSWGMWSALWQRWEPWGSNWTWARLLANVVGRKQNLETRVGSARREPVQSWTKGILFNQSFIKFQVWKLWTSEHTITPQSFLNLVRQGVCPAKQVLLFHIIHRVNNQYMTKKAGCFLNTSKYTMPCRRYDKRHLGCCPSVDFQSKGSLSVGLASNSNLWRETKSDASCSRSTRRLWLEQKRRDTAWTWEWLAAATVKCSMRRQSWTKQDKVSLTVQILWREPLQLSSLLARTAKLAENIVLSWDFLTVRNMFSRTYVSTALRSQNLSSVLASW